MIDKIELETINDLRVTFSVDDSCCQDESEDVGGRA